MVPKIILGALVIILTLFSVEGETVIESPKTTNWGDWGKLEGCPDGRYVHGFELRVEPNHPKDKTDLNGIRLFCGNPHNTTTIRITSSFGPWGKYNEVKSCFPDVLTGFQLRVQPDMGQRDNVATTNVRFYCGEPPSHRILEGVGSQRGIWTEERHCPANHAICGIQTQVQKPRPPGLDDTALNNVKVKCCRCGMRMQGTKCGGD